MVDLTGLPGAERVQRALTDLAAGRQSLEAVWLRLAARRLQALGLAVPVWAKGDPELVLYERMRSEPGDAYYRYNALRRELDSFLSALEARQRRARAPVDGAPD